MIYFKKYFLFCFLLLFLEFFGATSYLNLMFVDKKIDNTKFISKNIIDTDIYLKQKFASFDRDFSENFTHKLFFVEKYGYLQKILGKNLVDDAMEQRRVYKGKNGMLYYIVSKKNINDKAVNNIEKLKSEINRPFLFVMPPNKHTIASINFPKGLLDYSTTNSNDLYKSLMEKGVLTLNLNEYYFKEKKDDLTSFYLNDTHWKNETAFWGYQKTIDFLEKELSYTVDNINNSNNISNYSLEKFKNIYIGSMGKRVGKDYIVKKDDYTLITPAFNTSYSYKKYDDKYNITFEKNGNFKDVFVNKDVLSDIDIYKDRYTAMMGYGSPYEIINNKNIKNNSKIVLIKDSFAMPYSAYLSTNIGEIHMFDTRSENIRKTMKEKIKAINPDFVLFVCSPNSIFYFEDMFDF
ncbi:MAG: hypothetical protein HXL16_02950 [Peptostreptococcaceae bacterium]|nr:hypothetical protein [Peptostreptococcaceae bacterium]